MDLVSVWKSFSDQGILFWSATCAVALGVTLILTAGIIQVRSLRRGSDRKIPSFPETKAEKVQESSPQVKTPEKPLEFRNSFEMAGPWPEKPNCQELHLLLARLRSAADQLENFQRIASQNTALQPESPLKDNQDGVDYLFRAGTG